MFSVTVNPVPAQGGEEEGDKLHHEAVPGDIPHAVFHCDNKLPILCFDIPQ